MLKPKVEIDLKALKYNFDLVKSLSNGSPIMTMVKADAYGHGIIPVASVLKETDYFGVARLDEAILLRENGIKSKILAMEGFFDRSEFHECIENDIDFVIHQSWQVQVLHDFKSYSSSLNVWIKVNTGMNRLGFSPEHALSLYQVLTDNGFVNIKLITHLSSADDVFSDETLKQKLIFSRLVSNTNNPTFSVSNSADILNNIGRLEGVVRTGLAIYGIDPITPHADRLIPVMTLTSSVIAINNCEANSPVGYSGAWVAPIKTKLAVIAIGYGDGYPRHAISGTPVFINGKTYPLVGAVSMDMITVDIGLDSNVKVGDLVELWGGNLPVSEVATKSKTIPYDLLCSITNRVERCYID
ncbi:alanine racemase [Vibrio sp. 10N.286.48.B7]|uniref:alanine racemase n=1 Tax=Vibrio sp. 10N.286.48.B7 TaxID=1880853 RepID=UPI000C8397F0|nr:alanine racemase [Vibrio sp. 10N.286.48.B7]PMH80067.1 alanine racemase [Vibrio sp. 10N.286.48.B7]